LLATAEGEVDVIENADFVLFDDVYYKAKDSSLTKLFEKSPLANGIPPFETWSEDYYYRASEEGVEIYDAETSYFQIKYF